MSSRREGPLRSWTGVKSKMMVTHLVAVGSAPPHMFINADHTHTLKTRRVGNEHAPAFVQDSGVGGIP